MGLIPSGYHETVAELCDEKDNRIAEKLNQTSTKDQQQIVFNYHKVTQRVFLKTDTIYLFSNGTQTVLKAKLLTL